MVLGRILVEEMFEESGKIVAVGMPVARHPPHGSVLEVLPHTALTSSLWRQNRSPGNGCVR